MTIPYDTIIIGGSYSGLSVAMALGRSLRSVLVIDSGQACNLQTPHAHNIITLDGRTPKEITMDARQQVAVYPGVKFQNGLATAAKKTDNGFIVTVDNGESYTGKKLHFATGVKDLMPAIPGFAECWGITVIHCPYCHGYEAKHQRTGILANGDVAYHYAPLVANLTDDLTVFTNGPSTLTEAQTQKLTENGITVDERPIDRLQHTDGQLEAIHFHNGESQPFQALYNGPANQQHCPLPAELGCELTEHGLLKVEMMQRTTVPGITASGDCTTMARALTFAMSSGTMAGATINGELSSEAFTLPAAVPQDEGR